MNALFMQALLNTWHFSIQVLSILPPVLLLVGLLESWLPTPAIQSYLGEKSGMKGIFLSVLMGSVAAGPLVTAFPIAASFSKKGGRIANTIIFLGAWGTIKIPLLMLESQFMGWKFSLIRLVLTIPLIILTGLVTERILK